MHVDDFDLPIRLTQPGDPWIRLPKRVGGRPDIRLKLPRMRHVKLTHSSRKHHDVTGTLVCAQDELTHVRSSKRQNRR